MTSYLKQREALRANICPTCMGLGSSDDASSGDISYNSWTCRDCNGTGLKKPISGKESQIWRHIKSGGLYRIVAEGMNEADLEPVVIYESLFDGAVWVRPRSEFLDGRFVNLNVDEVCHG